MTEVPYVAARPGTRENPLRLDASEDLERATRHVHRPSPAEASAGNYRMAHVVAGGLPVTIEAPRDGIRRGTGPDGVPWEVRTPADYGYVKRTEGADGDQVDVYLGPSAHEAEALPVWVVDQRDADTGAFDEHKVMLGFPDVGAARKTYHAGFSDGRGPDRVGAVVRMTFDEFRRWLRDGRTDRPLAYRQKSASGNGGHGPYGAVACSCARCRALHGGHMTTTDTAAAVVEPKALGGLTSFMSKIMGRLTPEERTSLIQDAAVLSAGEIGKATSLLDEGDDHTRIGQVEDLWDGPPDDRLKTSTGHGPGSTAAPGSVNTGPSQSASGSGAAKMEPEYSRHAPQGGVQSATEKLGRDVAGMRGAMKSMIKAFEGMQTQMTALQSGATAPLDEKALGEIVAKAVAASLAPIQKSFAKATKLALRKAEDDENEGEEDAETEAESGSGEEEEDEEEEDEEAEQEESGSGTEIEIVNELEEEDEADAESEDEKKAAHKAAVRRLMAKSRLKWATRRIAKAKRFTDSNKPKAAARQLRMARFNIAKAKSYTVAAKSLRGGLMGSSTMNIRARIAKAKKGLAAAQEKNQDKWPASTEKRVGKAQESAQAATQPDIAKAVDQISKAASGMGMMTASVQELMTALTSRGTGNGADGGSGRLPPVFALAKAGGNAVAAAEMELGTLRDANTISFDDFNRARDALQKARMGMPPDVVQAIVRSLPDSAQQVLNRAAAA